MINLKKTTRVAGLGAAAVIAMGLLSTGAANADTFVRCLVASWSRPCRMAPW